MTRESLNPSWAVLSDHRQDQQIWIVKIKSLALRTWSVLKAGAISYVDSVYTSVYMLCGAKMQW